MLNGEGKKIDGNRHNTSFNVLGVCTWRQQDVDYLYQGDVIGSKAVSLWFHG